MSVGDQSGEIVINFESDVEMVSAVPWIERYLRVETCSK